MLVIFFPRSGAFIDFARGRNTNSFARRLQTMVLKLKLARQVDPSACCQHTSDFSLLSVTSNKFRNSGYWIGISSSIFVDGLVSLSFILHAIVRFWIGSLLCQLFCPLFLGVFFLFLGSARTNLSRARCQDVTKEQKLKYAHKFDEYGICTFVPLLGSLCTTYYGVVWMLYFPGNVPHISYPTQMIVCYWRTRSLWDQLQRRRFARACPLDQERECGERRWSDTVVVHSSRNRRSPLKGMSVDQERECGVRRWSDTVVVHYRKLCLQFATQSSQCNLIPLRINVGQGMWW